MKRAKTIMIQLILGIGLVMQVYGQNKEESTGIPVGFTIQNFTAADQYGNLFDLSKLLVKGPVVILFYRGQWCPVCNRHLKSVQDSLALINIKGATVIAISPEKQLLLNETVRKTGAQFTLLHDEGYRIANAFNIVFTPDEKVVAMYNERLNANLEQAHSDNSTRLPIPATYIIGQDYKVLWRHVNPDYKQRASVKEILSVLATIESTKK